MIIDELIALLGYRIEGEDKLKRFTGGIDQAEQKLRRASAAMNTMQVAVGSFIGTLATAAVLRLSNAIGSLPGNVIRTSAQFEGFQVSLETIEGSAEKAKASMDWVSNFAAKTPYELAGVTEAFIKLKAYGFDPMDGSLTTLGDTASAMNKPLNQAVEAFADAATFQFERLKEFGITSQQKGDQVTFSWTQNGKALTKVVKKNSKEITKFLLENFGSRFNGAMIRQSKTWNGMMSNLSDSWSLFMKKIGDKGIFERVKQVLGGLLDYLGKLDADGTLDRWAKSISNGMTWTVNEMITQGQRLKDHWDFIKEWINLNPEWLSPLLKGLTMLALIKFPYLGALLVLDDILSALQGKASVIGDFAKYLHELTGINVDVLTKILSALAMAGAGMLVFGSSFGVAAIGIKALAGATALFSSANVAAGITALTGLGTAGAAAGFLALASSVAAAAASLKLLYDEVQRPESEKLNRALKETGKGIADWFIGEFLGGNHTPEAAYELQKRKDAYGPQRPTKAKQSMEEMLKNVNPANERSGDYKRAPDFYDAIDNFNNNSKKSGTAIQPIINDSSNKSITTNTTVNIDVQRIEQAADAAANAVRSAVASKSSAVQPKARTQMGHF